MDDKERELIENQNTCTDIPSDKDRRYEDVFEGSTVSKNRFPQITMFNQGVTPACTRYALWMLNNGQNINEYSNEGFTYHEIDPMGAWVRHCKKRGSTINAYGSSLQSALSQAKDEGIIDGYLRCTTKEHIKKAIDQGYFIYTGSNNGDRSAIRKDTKGIYKIRTDGKYVGHAWSVIGYDDSYVLAINSYGKDWGNIGGKFKVDRNTFINRCYTKYAIIDKDDSGKFLNFKYLKEIERAVNHGFFNGDNMNGYITRNQAAAVTTRIVKYLDK